MFEARFQSFEDATACAASGLRIKALRTELARRDLTGFIVPRADRHQNEYVPACEERLAWLTGFTGSAGMAVVLRERAAVFVDGQYAGHVDEFNGVGKAMLLTPGQHRLRIALPGYLPFDTMVDLRPQQKLKIQTDLVKGSITEAGSQVIEQ